MDCRLEGITVHYETFGEGRPLVVLPGWPDEWRVPADYLEPHFETRGSWRRIYLDLPGRGETPGEAWITTNDQVLGIVLGVLDRVIGEERFVLAGHSAGAYLARGVLRDRWQRVDGLLQVVPVIDPDGDDVPLPVTLVSDEALVRRAEAELGPEVAEQFASFFVVQSTGAYERMKALLPSMRGADEAFLARLEERLSVTIDPPPESFDRPALFVLGRQDSVVGYRGAFGLDDAYPRATIAVLDRAGHGLPWEQPKLFGALVDDWLDRVEDAAPTVSPGP
jgi:pimeloyl-ACP methyl ester carboxylesterase